jgi:hypothetical protein
MLSERGENLLKVEMCFRADQKGTVLRGNRPDQATEVGGNINAGVRMRGGVWSTGRDAWEQRHGRVNKRRSASDAPLPVQYLTRSTDRGASEFSQVSPSGGEASRPGQCGAAWRLRSATRLDRGSGEVEWTSA